MAQAAYKTVVGVPGAPTVLTDAPTTLMPGPSANGVAGKCDFQITDSTKRLLDSNTPVVVKYIPDGQINKRILPANQYTVNYAAGIIVGVPSGLCDDTVFVSGKFIPFTNIGGANNYSLELTSELLDDTDFNAASSNGGHRTRKYGLLSASVSVSAFSALNKAFSARLQSRQDVVLTIRVGGGDVITGLFVVESVNQAGEAGGLETEDISFQLNDNAANRFHWA